nr:MAG TPA: hypothetical protein [Caudoviricetes sp.]
MGEILEKVVEGYLQQNQALENVNKDDPGGLFIFDTVKEKLVTEITEEIYIEKKQQLLDETEKTISERKQKKRMKEISGLLWEGFFVAFIVGLFVNQVTDILSILKGALSKEHLESTIVVIIITGLMCFFVFCIGYMKRVIAYLKSKD